MDKDHREKHRDVVGGIKHRKDQDMTMYSVYDNTTGEGRSMDTLSESKKWIKERIKLGHDAGGDKMKVYANGEWVPCGPIKMDGSNKVMITNTRMKKANY